MRTGSKPRVSPDPLPNRIGAADAERLLGISRTKLHVLASSGRLHGRVLHRRGGRRHWQFKLTDVLALKRANNFVKYHKTHRLKKRETWGRHFGNIPTGFTVACRDYNEANLEPSNLCLVPLKVRRRLPHEWTQPGASKRTRTLLSREQVKYLRSNFSTQPTAELAAHLGCTVAALRARARRMRLRKSIECIRAQARASSRLPLGTERVKEHTGLIWVKVSLAGPQYEQWRPKQQVVWESANSRKVPRGWCVIFKDGDKRNFDAMNLELISKRERSAEGFARFLSYPKELQAVIKLNAKLGREIQRKLGCNRPIREPARKNTGPLGLARRWTADMDEVLYREYPTNPVQALAESLGVSLSSLRQRARRLQIRRLPETIIAEARAAAVAIPH